MRNYFCYRKLLIIVALLFICSIAFFLSGLLSPQWSWLERNPTIRRWHRDGTADRFCVWFNFTKASLKSLSQNSITLCTHGSIGYSHFVLDYAKNWQSSISVSLLIDGNGIVALAAFKKLFHCNPLMNELVTTHIVWRESLTSPCTREFIIQNFTSIPSNLFPKNCDIEAHKSFLKHSLNYPYPPNTMRNIARHGAGANTLHLIADIENHFSENAAVLLESVASNVTEDFVVAIRRFEYEATEAAPKNPQILKHLMDAEKAMQFHLLSAGRAHLIPNLDNWLNYSVNPFNHVRVDPLEYLGYAWEPQLIVLASHPYHFEGFPIRFTDQQALPFELCRANVSFGIVTHVFSFHDGIKRNTTEAESLQREMDVPRGEVMSELFLNYLSNKYPNTKLYCGRWRNIKIR